MLYFIIALGMLPWVLGIDYAYDRGREDGLDDAADDTGPVTPVEDILALPESTPENLDPILEEPVEEEVAAVAETPEIDEPEVSEDEDDQGEDEDDHHDDDDDDDDQGEDDDVEVIDVAENADAPVVDDFDPEEDALVLTADFGDKVEAGQKVDFDLVEDNGDTLIISQGIHLATIEGHTGVDPSGILIQTGAV